MSDWLTSLPNAKPDLLRVIYDFNYRPGFWVHHEYLNQLPEQERKCIELLQLKHHDKVNQWLIKIYKIDQLSPVWNFENPTTRLALLSFEDLQRLAHFFGAAYQWQKVSALIGKRQIQDFKSKFGEDVYNFSLRRARVLPLDSSLQESKSSATGSIEEEILKLGWAAIGCVLKDSKNEILQRLKLKLSPATWEFFQDFEKFEFNKNPWIILQKLVFEFLPTQQRQCFA